VTRRNRRPAEVSRRRMLRLGGLAAGAAMLPSCSSSGDELAFWNFYGPAKGIDTSLSDWFVKLAADWNDTHRQRLRLRYLPNTDYIGGPTLQTAFSAGAGPDVFLLSPGDFVRYLNAGALADLTSFLPAGIQQEYLPGSLETRTVDGRVYGLPMEREPLGLFYSTEAFERAGLSAGDAPADWTSLLDVAEGLTTAEQFGLLLETGPGYYQNFTWYPFLWMAGGSPISRDQRRSSFDSAATRDALRLWQEAIERGVAPRRAQGTGGNDSISNLAFGYCAMQVVGIWAIGEMALRAPDFRYGVVPLPAPAGRESISSVGGWAMVANARSPHRDEACEFVAWALGRDDAACVERGRIWNTELKRNLPARRKVQEAAERRGAFDEPAARMFVDEIAATGRGEPRYPVPVYRAISDALQACQLDGVGAADAAATAAESIDTYLQGYEGVPIL
jgi:multiple sugar transport system substrate-binding protein